MTNKYGPRIVTDGLVLALDAADKNSYPGSGSGWYDLSGNSNHCTLTNSPSFSNNNGGKIILDGINDWIATSFNPNINNNRLLTMEIWFRDDSPGISSSTNTALISNYGPNSTTPFINMHITSEGKINLSERNSLGTQSSYGLSSVVTDGGWKQIVGSCNSSQLTLSINAVISYAVNRVGGTITSGQNWVIGGNHLGRYQSCDISIVRVYLDKALSAEEIKQNYDSTKSRYNL